MRPFPFRPADRLLIPVLALVLAACDDNPVVVVPPVTGEVTVDASAAFTYLGAIGDSLKAVAVTDQTTSSAWDVGFFATTVTTNGGAAGPGGVSVACVCANAAATNTELQAMTPAGELTDFDSVTAATATGATFGSDQLLPAIGGWYTGAGAAATVTPNRAWIVREGSASAVLGKFRVTQLSGASASYAGQVTIEFAVQPASGQPFGATQTATVNVAAGGPVYFDLTTGAVTDASNWDLRFEGWAIRVNGGVSGSGTVRAVLDTSTAFANITATYAGFVPPQAYSADAFAGVFNQSPWYRYNITGSDNQIWPTFNVYLLRRGTTTFKVQLINYYGPAGQPRQITVRYQRIAG